MNLVPVKRLHLVQVGLIFYWSHWFSSSSRRIRTLASFSWRKTSEQCPTFSAKHQLHSDWLETRSGPSSSFKTSSVSNKLFQYFCIQTQRARSQSLLYLWGKQSSSLRGLLQSWAGSLKLKTTWNDGQKLILNGGTERRNKPTASVKTD